MQEVLAGYRDQRLTGLLLQRVRRMGASVREKLGRKPVLMEVCGTHTMALSRSGLRSALADCLELKSGPGCPVCVTDYGEIDAMIALARQHNTLIATFGDMLRVPGSRSSLEREKALGAQVKVFYSPAGAVEEAMAWPEKQVVFLGVGFETTAPLVAASLAEAQALGLKNYSVYMAHKLLPPVLQALVQDPQLSLDGFLLPGHASAIIGRQALAFLAEFSLPGAITGFEPLDMLMAMDDLLAQILRGEAQVTNCYRRVVGEEGNKRARQLMERYFQPVVASWRGLGSIPASGLALRPEYQEFDATRRFHLELEPPLIPRGCRCGELLRGQAEPRDCRLFGRKCTPAHPVGPCMVSSEGACAAYYQYELN